MSPLKQLRSWFRKRKFKSYFRPKNEVPNSRKCYLSPLEKYKLEVAYFSTKKGCWSYSEGRVYRLDRVNEKIPIAIIQRNYSSFPYHFMEGHANGHDYLICGEDYQGQTVIELDTGKRKDVLSEGADKGYGFCWGQIVGDFPWDNTIVVSGCHWACPYEYRFYDFSDPMRGWPEIVPNAEIDGSCPKYPESHQKGIFECYQTRDESDEGGETENKEPIVDAIQTFKREGLKLNRIAEWVSDYEKDRRVKNEEAWIRHKKEISDFKANDPLYLAYLDLVKDPVLTPEDYESSGITYQGWAEGSSWSGDERRWCRRIVTHKGRKGTTVDLEWATTSGPIKLVFFRDGESNGVKFFEHSVEGMKQAFEAAKEYARG